LPTNRVRIRGVGKSEKRPNGGVTYLGAHEVSRLALFVSFFRARKDIGGAFKTLEVVEIK
jgi:hypothetical protein